jgi:hypothetical protein
VQKQDFEVESAGEPFKDEGRVVLPPSFPAMEAHINWMRPREYLQQIAIQLEARKQRDMRKSVFKARRSSTRLVTGLLGLGSGTGEEVKDTSLREPLQVSGSETKRIK